MKRHLLIFGYGYTARALSTHLLSKGWSITGTTRSAEKADTMQKAGIEPILWTDPDERVQSALSRATAILFSIGPDQTGDPVFKRFQDDIARSANHLTWAGYLSTTGVYGNFDGAWVDETTPLTPTTQRGLARKLAEEQWQSISDLPLHIFRLAGIYGPTRGPFSKVRSGQARRIIKEGQYFSRIHVEDITTILAASLENPNRGNAYNLCDDDPAPPQDVIGYAAELLDLPLPPIVRFEDAELSPMARSFYAENKRVSNQKAKQEFGITLKYPSYRKGLQALLEAEGSS